MVHRIVVDTETTKFNSRSSTNTVVFVTNIIYLHLVCNMDIRFQHSRRPRAVQFREVKYVAGRCLCDNLMFHHIEHSVVSSGRGIDVVLVVVSLVECHDSQCFIGFLHALRSDRGEVFDVVDRCTSRGGAASLTRMATTIRR